MFLNQINAPRVDGIVHTCNDTVIFPQDYNGAPCIRRCTICGKSRYDYLSPMTNMYGDMFDMQSTVTYKEDSFMDEYKAITGDMRTDEEVEEMNKSLWQKIKELFK